MSTDEKRRVRELLLARDRLSSRVRVLKNELYDKRLELSELNDRLEEFDGELIDEWRNTWSKTITRKK